MKPLHDYIIVELIEEESPIILLNKDVSPKGKVTAISDKVKDIKVGDIIYYRAQEHEYKGQHFIRADEVLGLV